MIILLIFTCFINLLIAQHLKSDYNTISNDDFIVDIKKSLVNDENFKNITQVSGTLRLNRKKCNVLFGERRFLNNKGYKPPMLYTFPGSGNTWVRLLVEYSSGILTGSIYQQELLKDILPGDTYCSYQVSLVKLHPIHYHFSDIDKRNFSDICSNGGLNRFERAILLIRDPYHSIWSEYLRRITRSHTGRISFNRFNQNQWLYEANALSIQYSYMIEFDYTGVEATYSRGNVMYIRYEDLINKESRESELIRVLDFLGLKTDTNRIKCAFILSENSRAHRMVFPKIGDMTKDKAYTASLVCHMWRIFGARASKYGYSIWKNVTCKDVLPITIPQDQI